MLCHDYGVCQPKKLIVFCFFVKLNLIVRTALQIALLLLIFLFAVTPCIPKLFFLMRCYCKITSITIIVFLDTHVATEFVTLGEHVIGDKIS